MQNHLDEVSTWLLSTLVNVYSALQDGPLGIEDGHLRRDWIAFVCLSRQAYLAGISHCKE